jgi:hypothetical protein
MVGPRLDPPEAPDLAWRIRETEAPVDLIERRVCIDLSESLAAWRSSWHLAV